MFNDSADLDLILPSIAWVNYKIGHLSASQKLSLKTELNHTVFVQLLVSLSKRSLFPVYVLFVILWILWTRYSCLNYIGPLIHRCFSQARLAEYNKSSYWWKIGPISYSIRIKWELGFMAYSNLNNMDTVIYFNSDTTDICGIWSLK